MRPRVFDISSAEDIAAFDRDHLWHPYAALPSIPAPLVVESAQGTRIRLADGRELVDGVSSWWTAIHGYGHPALIEAARAQMEELAHVMFGGLTHKPAAELGALLLGILPEPLEAIFYCDSGSVAVEVAIKMAIQYWEARGRPERKRLITVRGGYHGDTFMAMSVCDPIDGMHARFRGAMPVQIFAEAPRCRFGGAWDEADVSSFESLAAQHADTIAAAILEPIVHDRLEYRGGDCIRVLCGERFKGRDIRLVPRAAETAPRRLSEDLYRHRAAETRVHAVNRVADRHSHEGIAVVAAADRDEAFSLRPAARLPVLDRHLYRDLNRHGSGVAVEYRLERFRQDPEEQGAELSGRLVREAAEHHVRQFFHLGARRFDEGGMTVAVNRGPPG